MRIEIGHWQIRSFRPSDAEALARNANHRDVSRNMRDTFPHPYELANAHEWIDFATTQSPETNFAIAGDAELIGGIGITLQSDVNRRSAEIGYWLGEQHWGQGIATAALKAMTEWAFAEFDLVRLYGEVFEWNPASGRVLEKAGYNLEGRMRKSIVKDDQIIDALLYAQVRD
ncbi:MAG: GNAT family N-acetyltransferase [Chloroflexi bacterium]|nr:GNAT family N-acetyltransferase [Chloroflexota bacterium]